MREQRRAVRRSNTHPVFMSEYIRDTNKMIFQFNVDRKREESPKKVTTWDYDNVDHFILGFRIK